MRNLSLLVSLCCFVVNTSLHSQYRKLATINTDAVWITSDNHNFLYAITEDGNIEKWNIIGMSVDTIYSIDEHENLVVQVDTVYTITPDGREITSIRTDTATMYEIKESVYYDTILQQKPLVSLMPHTELGKPVSIQWIDNGKLLAYYPSASTAVIYDRNLNETKRISLHKTGLQEIPVISRGPSNTLWIYDKGAAKIILYNYSLHRLEKGFEMPDNIDPESFVWTGNHLVVCDNKKGAFVFDANGKLQKHIRFKCSRVEVTQEEIALIGNEGIKVIDKATLQDKEFIPLSGDPAKATHYTSGYILLNHNGKVVVYEKK